MPRDQQPTTSLRLLLSEAHDLCRRAQQIRLAEAEKIALQQRFGEITADTIAAFGFQGALRRPVHDWLVRAELAVRTKTMRGGIAANAEREDLLKQLRHLVDTANAAVLRRSRSHATWTVFYSANVQIRPSASNSEHHV